MLLFLAILIKCENQLVQEKKIKKHKKNGCFTQLMCVSFYQSLVAEFLGTYLLVLFAVGFGLYVDESDVTAALTGSLASGFMVFNFLYQL